MHTHFPLLFTYRHLASRLIYVSLRKRLAALILAGWNTDNFLLRSKFKIASDNVKWSKGQHNTISGTRCIFHSSCKLATTYFNWKYSVPIGCPGWSIHSGLWAPASENLYQVTKFFLCFYCSLLLFKKVISRWINLDFFNYSFLSWNLRFAFSFMRGSKSL